MANGDERMDNENKLPIIYVRGYAGTQNEVEDTVDDPFYGFNKGATHIRVGPAGDPQFFAFESPLVRLMSDHGYCDVFEGDRISTRQLDETRKSIWIYRYYDRTSKTFKEEGGFRLTIEEAAKGLRDLIIQVKEQTEARHVILIAHSMGGLICRSLIQKIYREDAQGRSIPEQMPATAHIHKLFTYGTPHGGIHFDVGGGTLEWIRDQLGWNHADDFGRQRMYEYLTPGAKPNDKVPEKFIPNDLDGAFPVDRVFCVVGTNARDYDVAYGLSRRSVGPQSDGLVQIEHAYVKNSHRAYIHRSHSGRYGMVNSEEGYQCLQRFLFGDVKIHATLLDIDLPEKDNTFYQAEVRISIRTLPSLVHEQTVGHYCPISLHQIKHPTRYPLFTAFLMHKTKPSKMRDDEFDPTMRYALGLTVHSFTRHNGLFSFTDHIESMPRWSDWLIFDVTPHAGSNSALYSAKCSWLSKNAQPTDTVNFNLDTDDDDSLTARISVPAEAFPVLGHNCKIELRTYNWK